MTLNDVMAVILRYFTEFGKHMRDKEYDVILPADVVKELQQIPVVSVVVAECVNADSTNVAVDVLNDQVQSVSEDTSSLMSGDVTNAEFCNDSAQNGESMNHEASKLLDEQQQDASLADCWSMARQGKGNFVLSQGLLYQITVFSERETHVHVRYNMLSSARPSVCRL